MPSTTRSTWTAVLVAAVTLTMTSCGGDDAEVEAGAVAETTEASTATTDPPAGDLDAWCLGWYSLTNSTGNPGPLLLELDEVTPAELRGAWEGWWPNDIDSQEWRGTNRELDRYFAANCRGRVEVGTPITQP